MTQEYSLKPGIGQRLLNKLSYAFGKTPILWCLKATNGFLRRLTSITHRQQLQIEWGIGPLPEWFDHNLDLYYQWYSERNPLWLERGCFSSIALKEGAKVLELCCGDGFNARNFYSLRASEIIAVDIDPEAIKHARKQNHSSNISFEVCDIRSAMPTGSFDNIIWDAAIEHFTPREIESIMYMIKTRLKQDGVLSGYTLVEKSGGMAHPEHEYEFKSKDDLLRFLTPHFRNAKVFETIYHSRHNLYFYASGDTLPFDANWNQQVCAVS